MTLRCFTYHRKVNMHPFAMLKKIYKTVVAHPVGSSLGLILYAMKGVDAVRQQITTRLISSTDESNPLIPATRETPVTSSQDVGTALILVPTLVLGCALFLRIYVPSLLRSVYRGSIAHRTLHESLEQELMLLCDLDFDDYRNWMRLRDINPLAYERIINEYFRILPQGIAVLNERLRLVVTREYVRMAFRGLPRSFMESLNAEHEDPLLLDSLAENLNRITLVQERGTLIFEEEIDAASRRERRERFFLTAQFGYNIVPPQYPQSQIPVSKELHGILYKVLSRLKQTGQNINDELIQRQCFELAVSMMPKETNHVASAVDTNLLDTSRLTNLRRDNSSPRDNLDTKGASQENTHSGEERAFIPGFRDHLNTHTVSSSVSMSKKKLRN